jgi:hypothetical protein
MMETTRTHSPHPTSANELAPRAEGDEQFVFNPKKFIGPQFSFSRSPATPSRSFTIHLWPCSPSRSPYCDTTPSRSDNDRHPHLHESLAPPSSPHCQCTTVVGRLLPHYRVHPHDYWDSFGLDICRGAEYNSTHDAVVLRGFIRNTNASFVRISSLLPSHSLLNIGTITDVYSTALHVSRSSHQSTS